MSEAVTGIVETDDDEVGEPSDETLLRESRERFAEILAFWSDNRTAWVADAKFRAGDQWPEKIKKDREEAKLPCLTVDKLNQYVRQVVNDGRQNRPGPKVSPIDDGADVEAADGVKGMIRSIWAKSNGDDALDTALDHAAGCGFGWMRVATEFEHEGSDLKALGAKAFNQELRVVRVRNAMSVLLGPHQKADGSDAEDGFVIDEIPKERFKLKWPSAKQIDWKADGFNEGWSTELTIRVCERFYKHVEPGVIHMLMDGTVVTGDEYDRAVKELGAEVVPAVEASREAPVVKVKWCRFNGCEILEKGEFPSQFIPIVPVYGNEEDIEGKVTYSGLIRPAKDAQRVYNFSRSAYAQRVAMTPKAPWLAAQEQIDGFTEWSSANSGTHQVLRYRATNKETGESLGPPPMRINPSDVPAGYAQDMNMAEHDIQGAMGMYNASLGEKSNEKSGRAIMARQREGDTGTFHYHDNQNRALRQVCRILVDAMPRVYDRKRVVRLLGEDGTATMAELDPDAKKAYQQGAGGALAIYNLGLGRFDVDVETGPSYNTRRQEAVEAMMELMRAVPELVKVAGDVMVRNMDWPGAQEIADRLKRMLPPELQDGDGQDSPEVLAVKAQAQKLIDDLVGRVQAAEQGIQERDQALADMQKMASDLTAQLKSKATESMAKLQTAETGQYEAETQRMTAVAPVLTPEQLAPIVRQLMVEILTESAPPADAGPLFQ